MAGKPGEKAPDMQAKHDEIKAIWKEQLREILRQYGIEEDLEKLCRRGIYRVQDFAFDLNWFIIDKEKMCGDIHTYHDMYEQEMKKRHSDRWYPSWHCCKDEMQMMESGVPTAQKKRQGGEAACGEAAGGPAPTKEHMAGGASTHLI